MDENGLFLGLQYALKSHRSSLPQHLGRGSFLFLSFWRLEGRVGSARLFKTSIMVMLTITLGDTKLPCTTSFASRY